MKFTKMHGLGNDYLYVYGEVPGNIKDLCRKLSDRHFGAGSDGMIYISPSDRADFKMRIFNSDGSEAKMCGNGIRCVGKYVYDKGYTDKTFLTIETLSGLKYLNLILGSGKVKAVSVDMGDDSADPEKFLNFSHEPMSEICLDFLVQNGNRRLQLPYIPVNVGNPHAVIFVDDIHSVPLRSLGPVIEHHEDFPEGVNVEFVQVLDRRKLRMRVWERGSGITMACGTGACASVCAAVQKGYCKFETPVSVILDGGILEIERRNDGTVIMTGPASFVYDAECPEEWIKEMNHADTK